MGGLLPSKFRQFVDYLNRECDDTTTQFIGRSFYKLPTISVIYPILDRDKPWLCLWHISRLFIYTSIFLFFLFIGLASVSALSKISFVLSLNLLHIMLLLLMSLCVLWHSWIRRKNTSVLNRIIAHNFFDYQEDISGTWDQLKCEANVMRRWCLQSIVLIAIAGAMAIIVGPILNKRGRFNYDSVTTDFNFDLPAPTMLQAKTGSVMFYVEYAAQLLTGSICVLVLSAKCVMLLDNILPLQMHLKLLIIQFENIEIRAMNMYRQLYGSQPKEKGIILYKDHQFSECIRACLNKNIRHHQIILRAKNELNNTYGFYTFLYYIVATVAIAMGVLCAASIFDFPGTTISSIIMCLVETLFVALYSHFGQTCINLNTNLREQIYNTKWYHFRSDLKKTLNIAQTVTAMPFNFCYRSVLRVDYDSFATVMNSSYSFYNIVNASK